MIQLLVGNCYNHGLIYIILAMVSIHSNAVNYPLK